MIEWFSSNIRMEISNGDAKSRKEQRITNQV